MSLPNCIEKLILDYYWSHRIFLVKRRVHAELIHSLLQNKMNVFWNSMPGVWTSLFLYPHIMV